MALYSPGIWYGKNDFADLRAWCKQNNAPFFVIQTNEAKKSDGTWECGWCRGFYNTCLNAANFKTWMSTSRMYYCKGLISNIQTYMTNDVGTYHTGYPFGYVYKSYTECDYFQRPVTSSGNHNANTAKGQDISTPSKLIAFLKKYEITITICTVTFKDWDGNVLSTQEVELGKSATPPTTPPRSGYTFTGWDNSYVNIQSDVICTAQYKKNQPETDYGKLILNTYCFGAKHNVVFQCSDGKFVYYLYPENQLVDSLKWTVTFSGNKSTSGTMNPITVDIRGKWTCPKNAFARTGYEFDSWNTKVDGSGTTYKPMQQYDAPTSDLKLYAIWKLSGKMYAVLAGYSSTSSHNSLNSVSTDEIEKILTANYSNAINIVKLNGSDAKASAIITAINSALSSNDCKFLYVFLCGHGSRTTVDGKQCSRIKYAGSSYLTGVSLWDTLKDAKCKVFVNIHTCHAGDFFKSANPNTTAPDDNFIDNDDTADFIGDADKFFAALRVSQTLNPENNMFAAPAVSEPKLLIWTSNKANEYGWMVNSSTKTDDPTWWAAYGEVGTGLEVSFKRKFNASKSYAALWSDMIAVGEPSRKNPAYIKGTNDYNNKACMDGGPTPQKAIYGGFNEKEIVFTM